LYRAGTRIDSRRFELITAHHRHPATSLFCGPTPGRCVPETGRLHCCGYARPAHPVHTPRVSPRYRPQGPRLSIPGPAEVTASRGTPCAPPA
jgi:hypothetical protein